MCQSDLAAKSEMAIWSLEMKPISVNTSFLGFCIYKGSREKFPFEKPSSKANKYFGRQNLMLNIKL